MTADHDRRAVFDGQRGLLFSIAGQMLGSVADELRPSDGRAHEAARDGRRVLQGQY